jgi:hypothetical protein
MFLTMLMLSHVVSPKLRLITCLNGYHLRHERSLLYYHIHQQGVSSKAFCKRYILRRTYGCTLRMCVWYVISVPKHAVWNTSQQRHITTLFNTTPCSHSYMEYAGPTELRNICSMQGPVPAICDDFSPATGYHRTAYMPPPTTCNMKLTNYTEALCPLHYHIILQARL